MIPAALEELPTPYLLIDAAVVRRNIIRAASYAADHGLKLRPHTKTHKSVLMGRQQLSCGAIGLTVAKVGEAEVMAQTGADLLIAYPAGNPARARGLAGLARKNKLTVAVDTSWAIEGLRAAAEEAGVTIDVLIDLDVGMHRTGVASPVTALELARIASRAKQLRVAGLFCYPGHIRTGPQSQANALCAVDALLREAIELFQHDGHSTSVVSGGSTPTLMQSHLVPALTEIRPGTYVYNDMNTVWGGFCTVEDCAARVVATVVSDAVTGKVIVDAGSKTLTMDPCLTRDAAGHGYVVEFPDARVTRLSEEHGEVEFAAGASRPTPGTRVTIIPNHICPCVNLQDIAILIDGEDAQPLRTDARGMLS